MQTLKIAQWGQIHSLYLPLYVADSLGFFAENGLQLELRLAGNDDQTFLAVASGQADFGIGDPTFCAMRSNSRIAAKIIATIVDRTGVWGITRNPIIPEFGSVQDLVNLRIGSLPRPSTTFSLIRNLKTTNKRLLRSMQIVEAPIGEQYSLLAKGLADVVLDIEPFVSIAESLGNRVIYSLSKMHGPYTFTGLYTRQDVINRDSELVRAVVSAISRAKNLLQTDHQVATEVSQQLFPELERSVIENSISRLLKAEVWGKGAVTDQNSWQNAIATRQAIGEIFSDEIFSYIDNSFAAS